jgi:hypothetical protein
MSLDTMSTDQSLGPPVLHCLKRLIRSIGGDYPLHNVLVLLGQTAAREEECDYTRQIDGVLCDIRKSVRGLCLACVKGTQSGERCSVHPDRPETNVSDGYSSDTEWVGDTLHTIRIRAGPTARLFGNDQNLLVW